jgi:N-acetyl-anhydromuramyl-L-alanine amidase AmpD
MSGVAKPYIRRMAIYHINKEWPGLAYHYVIAPDGEVFKCNPVSSNTHHARGCNTKGIGVCLLGNFEVHEPTDAQTRALQQLIGDIRAAMPQVTKVIGHRQVRGARTACPGRLFTDAMLESLNA